MHGILALTMCVGLSMPGQAWSVQVSEEYQIKAAFIFNFMKFVQWPSSASQDDKAPFILGLVGKDPFGDNLDLLSQKPVQDRPITVKRFEPMPKDPDKVHPQIEQIKACHVLFISPSERQSTARLIAELGTRPILTIGDQQQFLDCGGVINFLVEERKVRFEIGLAKAKAAGLQISSQLLRLAKRVDEDR